MFEGLQNWLIAHLTAAIHIFVLGVGGFWLTHLLGKVLERRLRERFGAEAALLIARGLKYVLNALIALSILREMGFNLGAILGAAGVAGVAIGFAAQTSLSNLISGLFLVWERPFKLGDVIEVDAVTGAVHSLDLLAASIRTFDNRIVRIPNETLVKGRVINLTRMPIRRVDLAVAVGHTASIPRVMRLLVELADAHPTCLDEPRPEVVCKGFAPSSLDFQLGVWVERNDEPAVQNDLLAAIQERFGREGIAFACPRLAIQTNTAHHPPPDVRR